MLHVHYMTDHDLLEANEYPSPENVHRTLH